jgi:hypothetical protein
MTQTVTQRALRNGTRRALDGAVAAVTVPAGAIDRTNSIRSWCMSDEEAAAVMARKPPPARAALISVSGHVIDRMWERGQLNDRLHDTAVRLYSLFVRAGLEPRLVGEPGERREKASEIDDAAAAARSSWNQIVALVTGHRQQLLHGLCLGDHPGVQWLATVQQALADIEKPLAKLSRRSA